MDKISFYDKKAFYWLAQKFPTPLDLPLFIIQSCPKIFYRVAPLYKSCVSFWLDPHPPKKWGSGSSTILWRSSNDHETVLPTQDYQRPSNIGKCSWVYGQRTQRGFIYHYKESKDIIDTYFKQ